MGRGVHCTDIERKHILNLRNEGNTMSDISTILKCLKKSVFGDSLRERIRDSRKKARNIGEVRQPSYPKIEKKHPFCHRKISKMI